MANQLELIATLQVVGTFWLIGGLMLPGIVGELFSNWKSARGGLYYVFGFIAAASDLVLLLAFCVFWSELKLPTHDWEVVMLYVLTPLLPNLVGIVFAIIFHEWKKSRANTGISMARR